MIEKWEVFQGVNFLMVRKTGLGEATYFDKANGFICEIQTEFGCFKGNDEDVAHAKLIAAAPALLVACEKWKEYIKSEEDRRCPIDLRRILLDRAIELTEAAIEKAKKGT